MTDSEIKCFSVVGTGGNRTSATERVSGRDSPTRNNSVHDLTSGTVPVWELSVPASSSLVADVGSEAGNRPLRVGSGSHPVGVNGNQERKDGITTRFHLDLVASDPGAITRLLRRLLKQLGRVYGVRCTRISEASSTSDESPTEAQP